MEMKRSTKIIINIEYIAIILMVAVFVIGTCSFFVSCGAQWYTSINKSLLSPKIEVLGTISLLIFLTIAVSSYMILNTNYCENRSNTIQLFVINVTLISLWCYALFLLKQHLGGFFSNNAAIYISICAYTKCVQNQ